MSDEEKVILNNMSKIYTFAICGDRILQIIIIIIIIIIINLQGIRGTTGQKTLVRTCTRLSSNKLRRQGDSTVESASAN